MDKEIPNYLYGNEQVCILLREWDFLSKRTQWMSSSMAVALLLGSTVPLFPFATREAYAAAVAASITKAQGNSNSAYLEFSVIMPDSEVIYSTTFDSNRFDTYYGGSNSYGNQSYVNTDKGVSLQVTDTITNLKGNNFGYPSTASDISMARTSISSLQQGARLQAQYDARAISGSINENGLSFVDIRGKKGVLSKDYNGSIIRFKNTTSIVVHNAAPKSIPVYVDGGGAPNLNDGEFLTIVSSANTDWHWGYAYYRYNKSKQSIDLDSSMNSFVYTTIGASGMTSNGNYTFQPGDPVMSFPYGDFGTGLSGISNPAWVTYSRSLDIPSDTSQYDLGKYGANMSFYWRTNGTQQLDNFKIGYAQRAILYRNGQQVYYGYDSNFTDNTATDQTKPAAVSNLAYTYLKQSKQISVNWNAAVDQGTSYTYTIQGQLRDGSLGAVQDPKTVDVTSGIKGYIVKQTNDPGAPITDGAITTTGSLYTLAPEFGKNYVQVAAVDNNGNIGATQTIQLTDNDNPEIILTPSTIVPTRTNVNISVDASDQTSWIAQVNTPTAAVSGNTASFVADHNGEYTFTAIDALGNVGRKTITVSNIDRTVPVITIAPDGLTWQPNDVIAHVNVTDNFPLSNSVFQYMISKTLTRPSETDPWITADQPSFDVTIPKDQQGEWYIHVKAVDAASNTAIKTSNVYQIKALPTAIPENDVSVSSPTAHSLMVTVPASQFSYELAVDGKTYTIGKGSSSTVIPNLIGGQDYPIIITPINESGRGEPTQVKGKTRPDAPVMDQIVPVDGQDGTVTASVYRVTGANQYRYELKDLNGMVLSTTETENPNQVFHLSPNTKYSLTVTAINQAGGSLPTERTFLTVPTVAGLTITDIREDSLTLRWATVTGDSYYELKRDQDFVTTVTNDTYSSHGDMSGSNHGISYFTDMLLHPNYAYSYIIRAVNAAGSSMQYAITGRTLPGLPIVRIDNVQIDSAVIHMEPQDGVVYEVFDHGVKVASGKDQVRLTELAPGTAHLYEIVGRNESGTGAMTVVRVLTLPEQPKDISVRNYTTTSAQLLMPAVQGADKYIANVGGKEFVSATPSIDVSGLEPGKSYTASVYVENETGLSSRTSKALETLPAAATIRVDKVTEDTVTLAWDTVQGAVHYEIDTPDGIVSEKGTQMNVPSPGPGTPAVYGIRAVGVSGINPDTKTINMVGAPVPPHSDKESIVSVTSIKHDGARLYWKSFAGATEYTVFYKDEKVGTTTDTVFELSGLQSSTVYSEYTVKAMSSGGTWSSSYGVSFETLPYAGFTVAVKDITKREAMLYVSGTHETDTIVVKRRDRDNAQPIVYSGKDVQIPLTELSDGTIYTFDTYTMNTGKLLSKPQPVTFKTRDAMDHSSLEPISNVQLSDQTDNLETQDKKENKSSDLDQSDPQPDLIKFIDVEGRFSEDAIYALAKSSILNGYSDGTFRPKAAVTRAEFIMMLDNAGYLPAFNASPNSNVQFPDVAEDAWYKDSIQRAAAAGVVDGYPSGHFKPDRTLSRAEVAKILAKVGITSKDEALFSDEDSLPKWAKKEISQVGGAGIFIGYEGGKFLPKKTITREESALVVYRMMDK